MSRTQGPQSTRQPTSGVSKSRAVELNPYRITAEIRTQLDQAKMDGSWECELDDKDFDFIIGGGPENSVMWENVHVFRKGKKEEVLAAMNKTGEELIEEEAEISRQRREAKEKLGGQLKKPDLPEYHPKVKPGA